MPGVVVHQNLGQLGHKERLDNLFLLTGSEQVRGLVCDVDLAQPTVPVLPSSTPGPPVGRAVVVVAFQRGTR